MNGDPVHRTGPTRPLDLLNHLAAADPSRLLHVHEVPAREAQHAEWPEWTDPALLGALVGGGIDRPWSHQVAVAEAARAGEHVVVSTGTASGKSLGYLLPLLSDLVAGASLPGRGPTALYLSPTKALAADQLARVTGLALPGVRAATYDGDTPTDERRWIRDHANLVLTNPDLVHHSLLPRHDRWASFLRGLRYVVIDECHVYKGVFGSHLAAVLRRLRRVAARYRSHPTFVFASATVADPEEHASRLLGMPVSAVTVDGSPRASMTFALWEPALRTDESGAQKRGSTLTEVGTLLGGCVTEGVQTVAFARSRAGVEVVASVARERVSVTREHRIAAYRGGYLPEERRALETSLRSKEILGLAATNALELGIDVSGLDAVLLAGWPGTLASLWQQAGRAGRSGASSLAVYVAADDPLDTFVVHHPEAIFGRKIEATVVDPDNPYVLAPHLAAAAAELPLTEEDLPIFGPHARAMLDVLVERGILRRRPRGWFWAREDRPADHLSLRGAGEPVRIVETRTGRVIGTVDDASAHSQAHTGAVHLHQGQSWVVTELDLTDHAAFVVRGDPGWTTHARSTSDFEIVRELEHEDWGAPRCASATSRCATRSCRSCGACPAARSSASIPSTCRHGRSRRRRCGGRCPSTSWQQSGSTRPPSRGPHTPRSTPPSGCCRSSQPPTAGTSAGCRRRCTPTPACRPSSSTTATPAAPASPSAASGGRATGSVRPARRSRRATARPGARRASSPRSAATATSPWTSSVRSPCST